MKANPAPPAKVIIVTGARVAVAYRMKRWKTKSTIHRRKRLFQDAVAADVSRRELQQMARTDVRGYRVLMRCHAIAAITLTITTSLLASPATLKWRYPIGQNKPGSPAIGPGGEIFVAVNSAIFALRDQGSHAELISSNGFPKGVQGGVAVCPAGVAYLPGTASEAAGLLAFDFLHGSPARQMWYYDPTNAGGFASTPAVGPDGTVYAVTGDGDLHAIHPAGGTRRWVYARGAAASNNRVSPAVSSDGTVYFRQYGSQIHAVSPMGTNSWTRELLYQINSSPAIAPDGTVYVTSDDGYLYAFAGTVGPGNSPWPMFHQNAQRTGLASVQPRLNIAPTPEGSMRVGVQIQADRASVLEASSDLVHWSSLLTNTATTNLFQFTDPVSATAPQRFYRVMIR